MRKRMAHAVTRLLQVVACTFLATWTCVFAATWVLPRLAMALTQVMGLTTTTTSAVDWVALGLVPYAFLAVMLAWGCILFLRHACAGLWKTIGRLEGRIGDMDGNDGNSAR